MRHLHHQAQHRLYAPPARDLATCRARAGTRLARPLGGYFLWLELPRRIARNETGVLSDWPVPRANKFVQAWRALEQAQADAKTAHVGTAWDELLNPPRMPVQ